MVILIRERWNPKNECSYTDEEGAVLRQSSWGETPRDTTFQRGTEEEPMVESKKKQRGETRAEKSQGSVKKEAVHTVKCCQADSDDVLDLATRRSFDGFWEICFSREEEKKPDCGVTELWSVNSHQGVISSKSLAIKRRDKLGEPIIGRVWTKDALVWG